jgi:hypothetical protein
MNQFQVSDRVSFTARGQNITGTIIEIKTSKRKGWANRLAELYLGETHITKARVTPDPTCGGGVWTIPTTSLTKIGKADVETVQRGKNDCRLIMAAKRNKQVARASRRFKDIPEWVYDLKRGGMIDIEFKTWCGNTLRACKFVEISKAGKIAFIDPVTGKKRSSNPQFIRQIVNPAEIGKD